MPTICCAVGCKHTSGNGVCRLKRFPSDTKRSIVWEKNLRRNHWIRKDWELLCECHFHFSQFEKVREDGAQKLKHNAVPTLFPTHTIPLSQVDGSRTCTATGHKRPKVHFDDSAFEAHRADGLKKLKPNAVPTIHGISSPVNRKKRKRKIKQRIEFTFGENDNESFVLAEKVPAESKERDSIQISEIYCNKLDRTHKNLERRKRLKTIHVTEIVSNGLPLPFCGSDEQTKSIKLCSPFSNDEEQAVKINVNNQKRGRPPKVRIKDKEIQYKKNTTEELVETHSLDTGKETIDGSDIPASLKENLPVECYVCSKTIKPGHGVYLNIPTEATHILLVQRLEIIANVKGLLCSQEQVCSRCASLLNHVDRTEAELDVLKEAISVCTKGRNMHQKYRRNPEYAFNVQLLDRFGSLSEGGHNILSLDELFLIQEERKEMTGTILEDRTEDVQLQTRDESFLNINRNSVADETSLELDVDNCLSSIDGEPEEIQLNISHEMNLESALKEPKTTNVVVAPDVPASRTFPCTSVSEKLSNLPYSPHINSNTHVCKICSFKTSHDSVMVWHLRMHMKNGRWCDFCNVSIPMQESHFLSMKKKIDSGRTRKKPVPKSGLPVILPAAPKESSYPFKSLSLPLMQIEEEKAVLMVSKESESLQEAVDIPTAIVELSKNIEPVESVIEEEGNIESRTGTATKNKPDVGEEIVQCKINVPVDEPLCVKEFNRIAESGTEQVEAVNRREELTVTITQCGSLVEDVAVHDFSAISDQHCDINNAFAEGGIQVSKNDTLNDREVFCEDVEHSFLDTLSSQQEGKFPGILPEICSEPSEQGMITIVNDASKEANKDDSLAGQSENELAIAYENSVAALMCQSDDSESILSYH